MANAILNFHFDFPGTSLSDTLDCSWQIEKLLSWELVTCNLQSLPCFGDTTTSQAPFYPFASVNKLTLCNHIPCYFGKKYKILYFLRVVLIVCFIFLALSIFLFELFHSWIEIVSNNMVDWFQGTVAVLTWLIFR